MGEKITIEQSKLLGNATRVKIISTIAETPRTAKQVATILGQSPGNIHYHMKQLFEGGLVDLVETKEINGITEKYYQSKAKWFDGGPDTSDPALAENFQSDFSTKLNLRLQLTEEERDQLTEEFKALLEKWVKQTGKNENAKEYAIGIQIVDTVEKE
ncbi:ArsR family transcriptional regulator [Anaerobacillus alkaliphilus]|uniref:ArsR family transcriptional regulator n=1 Tax=Anaerobacillus alkaliphilus TaxID=1548597 RepID=A0A4Q0VXB4_9BACI|nr:winged helix-turn-helix domain-containing protein [Anaerobacillus alkaliphilus]RXJ04314.1 ArsR family transcriptional regulator [Anaerobacillus alkaliphilus]